MEVDGMKVSVAAIFLVMIAAVTLQISVFLDPQNNLATGGVTSVGFTLVSGSPVITILGTLIICTIIYAIVRVLKD